jgi:cobyrinic acid a,c-diamide synthase
MTLSQKTGLIIKHQLLRWEAGGHECARRQSPLRSSCHALFTVMMGQVMSKNTQQAFVLAATSSDCGKTTVTLGLLALFKQRGLRVQPFKVGPDYLDTSWHQAVTGVASRNLDGFMLPPDTVNALFARHMADVDIGVIEGVMGLYDGYGRDPHYCSSAGIARQLGCPVILLVEGKAVSTSLAATVMGFQHFDPQLNIAGVLINQVNSQGHYQLLKDAIEHYCQLPVLGYIPTMPQISLPSRHLGLVSATAFSDNAEHWQHFASTLEQTVDIERLLTLTTLSSLPDAAPIAQLDPQLAQGLTLAIAYDEAFHFYYQDNLDLFANAGVKIQRFSPLHDKQLPTAEMVWFAGGYPELYAAQLAENHSMLASVRAAHQRGVAIYGECGGLMYLGETLVDQQQQIHQMAGILPGQSVMGDRLVRFGYCESQALEGNLLTAPGEMLRGHEFHYSDFISPLPAQLAFCKRRDGVISQQWQGGWQQGNTFGCYQHLHFAACPASATRWLQAARQVAQ